MAKLKRRSHDRSNWRHAAQHIWMAGGIALMTMGVMTQVTRGQTGYALHAGSGATALYLLLIAAVLAGLATGLLSDLNQEQHMAAGPFWICAFGGFALLYGALILLPIRPAD